MHEVGLTKRRVLGRIAWDDWGLAACLSFRVYIGGNCLILLVTWSDWRFIGSRRSLMFWGVCDVKVNWGCDRGGLLGGEVIFSGFLSIYF
jgi:hypothetical protein